MLRSLVAALALAQPPAGYVEPPPSPPPAAAPAPSAAPAPFEPPPTAPPPRPDAPPAPPAKEPAPPPPPATPPPPPPAASPPPPPQALPPRHWTPPGRSPTTLPPPPLPPQAAPPPAPEPAAPEPAPAPPEAAAAAPPAEPPPALPARGRLGPQLVLAVGLAIAAGPMHDGYSHQELQGTVFEAEAQLGSKVNERLFLGVYGTAGAGPAGDAAWDACEAAAPDLACDSRTLRAGVLGRVDLLPRARRNPWISAGAGIQRNRVEVPRPGGPAGTTEWRRARGYEGRLAGGVDLVGAGNPSAAFGAYLGVSIGQYTDADPGLRPGDVGGASGPHVWVTLGVRIVWPR